MNRRSRAAWVGSIVVVLVAIWSAVVWANGQEFFDPGNDAKVDLAYVGRVRDTNGRFLKAAEIVIWSEAAALTFPAVSDAYGHYRTPDIGASLKEIGATVDPKELQVVCALPGYELVRKPKLPSKTHGRVELNFVLRPTDEQAAAHSKPVGPPRSVVLLVPALLALAVIGAAVRR